MNPVLYCLPSGPSAFHGFGLLNERPVAVGCRLQIAEGPPRSAKVREVPLLFTAVKHLPHPVDMGLQRRVLQHLVHREIDGVRKQ